MTALSFLGLCLVIIYDKLRVWTRAADGNNTLFALGEKSVGAISLGSASTMFSINNTQNDPLGEV